LTVLFLLKVNKRKANDTLCEHIYISDSERVLYPHSLHSSKFLSRLWFKYEQLAYSQILGPHVKQDAIIHNSLIEGDTKKRELWKNPTKIEEIQEKKLLTEIEPLQLAF